MANHLETSEQQTSPAGDLPAVEPPSAGFIVQLFLIPALIVGIIVAVYLLFGKIAGSQRTPEDYLVDLQAANERQRWSAARELASILPREREWQDNEEFARELAVEFEAQLASGATAELEIQYQSFLAVALGEFKTPAVIPALRQALRPEGNPDVRAAAIVGLGKLSDRLGSLPDADAVADLMAAAESDDVIIRKLAAFVLGAAGDPKAISVLEGLNNDSNREVQYNAASALARLGRTSSFETLQEMLDLERLRALGVPPEQLSSVPRSALAALAQLLAQSPDADLAQLRPQIETLSRKGNAMVRANAKELLIQMDRAKTDR
jgi:HEAT repeat protein